MADDVLRDMVGEAEDLEKLLGEIFNNPGMTPSYETQALELTA